MTYCFKCGKKMILKTPQSDTHERLVCPSCDYVHYVNPKVIVGVLPVINDQILLCKRAIEPASQKWTVPAGFLECNETMQDGALREATEEAGITLEKSSLYITCSIPRISQIYCIYLGILKNKNVNPGPETSDYAFFDLDKLPWDDIAFSSVTLTLKHYLSDFKQDHFPFRDLEL